MESRRTSSRGGFDVDYGRFYNTSYLKSQDTGGGASRGRETMSRSDYRRSPSLSSSSSSQSTTRVRHYHRPLHDNFSYTRRTHHTSNKGITLSVCLSVCHYHHHHHHRASLEYVTTIDHYMTTSHTHDELTAHLTKVSFSLSVCLSLCLSLILPVTLNILDY